MSNHLLWQRLGAASGIVYVVLLIGGNSIGGPDIQIVFFMEILAFLFFLFFLGNLWSALRRAEGGSGWLSATAFGAGLMSVTIKVASAAPVLAARWAGDGLDPQLARTLQDINNASFYLSFFPLAILLAAFAIVAIRFGAPLPRWLGWISAVVAVALLVDGMAGTLYPRDFGPSFLLFLLWTLAASIVLMRRAGVSHSAVSNAAATPPSVAP